MKKDKEHYVKKKCSLSFTTSQKQTLQFLKQLFLPYTSRVYIVGGFVRDNILNIDSSNDIDIEVYDISQELFEKLMNQIGALGVGKSFFVYKYQDIDISLPRVETKVSYGHKGFDVEICNDEFIASKRRDFTMNALMVNIYSSKLYDFYNGLEHINQKIICIIDEKSFKEDSLRVLRAMRFASKFEFKIENNSKKIISNMKITDLSKQRVVNEFEKMFQTKYLHYGFYYLFSLNIAKQIFDIVIDLKSFIFIYRFYKQRVKFFNVNLYEYYFLYILDNFIQIDIQKLDLPKKTIKFIKSQKKIDFNIDILQLHIIALDMPIKNWLGALDENIILIAKKYNIYDKILKIDIDAQDVINDGFKKEDIAKEIIRRKIKYINDKILKI
jgi:tRNA nucleotidyltransferase (CCA-adding enzyme)